MVCANADLEAVRAGVRGISAGALARRYGELGGEVFTHGKPAPALFERAPERVAPVAPRQVLMIGDGFATDIAGAARAGLDSLLVAGGIHAAVLGRPPQGEAFEALCRRHGCRPTRVIDELRWDPVVAD